MLLFPNTGPRRKRRPKVWRSASHLRHVRSLACCGCGRPGPSEAHHVGPKAYGTTASDALAAPLCTWCHRMWHDKTRVGPCSTAEESRVRLWCGVIASLGGSRIADNVDAAEVARRMAAEREAK